MLVSTTTPRIAFSNRCSLLIIYSLRPKLYEPRASIRPPDEATGSVSNGPGSGECRVPNYLILPERHEYVAHYETTFVNSTPIRVSMNRNLIFYLNL